MRLGFSTRRAFGQIGIVSVLLLLALAGRAWGYPDPGVVAGETFVADPSMVVNAFPGTSPHYLVYGTGNQERISEDRTTFADPGFPFPVTPAWWQQYSGGLSGFSDMWAPDVSYHNGQYWMYYAVSTAGSQSSAIGLATSASGLPGTWTDQGPVFTSSPGSNYNGKQYNAIDPNLLVDSNGQWWLTFGSFWDGIFMLQLDPSTGRPLSSTPTLYQLATRPGVTNDPIENGFVYQHGGYYYLFTSWDYCCQSTNSTYSIHVGRSTSPTGPYVDESGTSLLSGGGTTVLASHDYVIGPGGQSVVFDSYFGDHDLLVYHYYDSRVNGTSSLGINFLGWDANGFPYAF